MKLAQMERMAARLEFKDNLARHNSDNPSLADDFAFLTEQQGAWKPWMQRLQREGLTNIAGGLMGFENPPKVVDCATVTGSATEQNLIQVAGGGNGMMPIRVDPGSGTVYILVAGGKLTTAATPGTHTFAARIGPAPTNASPLFGAVSSAFTPLASMGTATPFTLLGLVLIRGGGTANTAVGYFFFSQTSVASAVTGGPSSVSSAGNFGGVSATFDSTLTTTALWIGVTHATSTTNTWIPQAVAFPSVN